TSVAYNRDGSLLATSSWPMGRPDPSEISIRDGDTGRVRTRIAVPVQVWALAFDPRGGQLASGDIAGRVVVLDLETHRPVRRFETGFRIESIAFLDRPRRLVTHGRDRVLLFDPEPGGRAQEIDPAGGVVRTLLVDRARSRVVVGFEGGAIGSVSLPD